jgi:acylphosphatase
MSRSPVRRRVVARGYVQGVFFRDTVRRAASESGVAGWVANRADGAVEAVFEGDRDSVEAMVELCRTGPPQATVTDLEWHEEDVQGLSGFTVR